MNIINLELKLDKIYKNTTSKQKTGLGSIYIYLEIYILKNLRKKGDHLTSSLGSCLFNPPKLSKVLNWLCQ